MKGRSAPPAEGLFLIVMPVKIATGVVTQRIAAIILGLGLCQNAHNPQITKIQPMGEIPDR